MSDEIKSKGAAVASAAAMADLSEAIEGSAEREPGEEVRSVRVFDDNYRCNWWVWDPAPGPTYLKTGRIIKSKFVRATMRGEELVVEDLSNGSKPG